MIPIILLLPIPTFEIKEEPFSVLNISFKAWVENISFVDDLVRRPLFAIAILFLSAMYTFPFSSTNTPLGRFNWLSLLPYPFPPQIVFPILYFLLIGIS